MVKNPPAMQETWARSLGQEDPLEKGKGKATHSSILSLVGIAKSRTRLSDCEEQSEIIINNTISQK